MKAFTVAAAALLLLVGSAAAQGCQVENCADCANPAICDACQEGFAPFAGEGCVACATANCAACDDDTAICDACMDGFLLDPATSTCVFVGQCYVENCLEW